MRESRLYSLFERRPATEEHPSPHGFYWERISALALHKSSAIRVFQSMLLEPAFKGGPDRSLRVAPELVGLWRYNTITGKLEQYFPVYEHDATPENVPFAGEVRP